MCVCLSHPTPCWDPTQYLGHTPCFKSLLAFFFFFPTEADLRVSLELDGCSFSPSDVPHDDRVIRTAREQHPLDWIPTQRGHPTWQDRYNWTSVTKSHCFSSQDLRMQRSWDPAQAQAQRHFCRKNKYPTRKIIKKIKIPPLRMPPPTQCNINSTIITNGGKQLTNLQTINLRRIKHIELSMEIIAKFSFLSISHPDSNTSEVNEI